MVMLAANCSDAETEESGSRPFGEDCLLCKDKVPNNATHSNLCTLGFMPRKLHRFATCLLRFLFRPWQMLG